MCIYKRVCYQEFLCTDSPPRTAFTSVLKNQKNWNRRNLAIHGANYYLLHIELDMML